MKNTSFHDMASFISDCKEELDDWFGIDLPMPELMVVTSAQDILDIHDIGIDENPPIGWADIERNRLYVLESEEVAKLYPELVHNFWSYLKHEYVHFYWQALVGNNYPVWMNEGLACYLAEDIRDLSDRDEMLNIERYFDRFDRKDASLYAIGYAMVEYLIEKFGRDKFVAFMNELGGIADSRTKKLAKDKFEDLFKKHFGFGLTNTELTRVFGL
jgi:hypothetical protein